MASVAALSGNMQDLSGRVDAAEEWQKDAVMSCPSHHTSHTSRIWDSLWVSPDPDQEVVVEVRKRVAKMVSQLPTLPGTAGEF